MPGPLGPAPKDTYPAIHTASASVSDQTITIRAPHLVSGPEGPPDMLAHNVRQEQDGILLCQCDEALHAGGCCEYGGQSEEYPYCDFCCPGFCGCDCHACSNGIPEIGSVDYPCICVSGVTTRRIRELGRIAQTAPRSIATASAAPVVSPKTINQNAAIYGCRQTQSGSTQE